MPNLSTINMKYGQEEIDINMEVVLLNLLDRALSAVSTKD